MRTILSFVLLCAACWRAEALALIKRVDFSQGASSNAMPILHAGNRGGFDAVIGQMQVIAVGQTNRGVLAANSVGMGVLTNSPGTNALFACGWFNVAGVQHLPNFNEQAGGTSAGEIFSFLSAAHGSKADVVVGLDGAVWFPSKYDSIVTNIPRREWVFMGVAVWTPSPDGPPGRARLYIGTNMAVAAEASISVYTTINRVWFGSDAGYAGGIADGKWKGRMAGLALYSCATNFSDVAYPSDDSGKPQRMTYYLNPTTGSDTNDGASIFTPWKSAERLEFARTNGWIGASSTGWVYSATGLPCPESLNDTNFCTGIRNGSIVNAGDSLAINTDADPLYMTNQITFHTPFDSMGVKLTSYGTNRARLYFSKPLGTNWSQYNAGTYPNVWQMTDADGYSVLWEDWKFMNSPTGATISAVAATLNTTPGSFWTDGMTMYLHPFSGNPVTNGREYQRSRKLNSQQGFGWWHSVYANAPDYHLDRLDVRGVLPRSSTNGENIAVYALAMSGTGRSVVTDSEFHHGGNHCHGSVHDTMTNFLSFISGSWFGDGFPDSWSGMIYGYTEMVEHCANTGTDRRAIYWDVDCSQKALIGGGFTNTGGFYSHDGVTGTNLYTLLWMSNFTANVAVGYAAEYMVRDGGWIIESSHLRGLVPGGSIPNVRRCVIDDWIGAGQKGVDVADSLIRCRYQDMAQRNVAIANAVFNRCTFDLSDAWRSVINQGEALFGVAANSELRMTNCVVRMTSTNAPLVVWIDTGGKFSAANNVYYGTNTMAGATNGSVYADPRLDAAWRPYSDSPARTVGTVTGPGRDLSGRWFGSRRTAGAYEYVAPSGFKGFAP